MENLTLLLRQQQLIEDQALLIQKLKEEIESQKEIIEMLKRLNQLETELGTLKIQEVMQTMLPGVN